MLEIFLERASTFAGDYDHLFDLVFWIVTLWFVAAETLFFFFLFRFRAKEGQKALYISGTEKHQKKWIAIPHYLVLLFDVVIIAGAMSVWHKVKITLPEPDVTIGIIGQQWAWTFVHPGTDNILGTDDDIAMIDQLHVVENKVYHFKLEATDVIHSFSVPVFRLKQDAIPGRIITGWFGTNDVKGEYDIQCAEICGIGHGIMAARIHIKTEYEHEQWLAEQYASGLNVVASSN